MASIAPPTLKVFRSIPFDPTRSPTSFIADISSEAIGWRRSIHSQGGFWIGTFKLQGELDIMYHRFYHWLGNHFEESSGGFITWEGLIYEMDLTWRGQTRRKSLDFMRNYWTALYTDEEGETQETAAVSDPGSVERHGRYEGLITQGNLTATSAAAMCATYLNYYAWPYMRGVSLSPIAGEVATLDVTVCGYIFTCNWRFESVGDGTQDNVSDWIREIVTTDCEFVEPTYIVENTVQVYKRTEQPQRALDAINSLVEIGDATGNPYRFYIGNDRKANYNIISNTPEYFVLNDRIMSSYFSNDDPWKVRPAVIRDTSWPGKETMPSGWLTDSRDFYASVIDVGVDTGLMVTTDLFDEAELLMAQLEQIGNFLEEEK